MDRLLARDFGGPFRDIDLFFDTQRGRSDRFVFGRSRLRRLRRCVWCSPCAHGRSGHTSNHLATLPYVDANRIGIMGGSYGGYMVLAALAYQPDVFDVGVDIFGVSNWLRTLAAIPAWWEAQRTALYAELGDPVKDEKMLYEISPVFHAAKMRKPLIVLQGANDPRVVKAESDDIVAAVKKNGVPGIRRLSG